MVWFEELAEMNQRRRDNAYGHLKRESSARLSMIVAVFGHGRLTG